MRRILTGFSVATALIATDASAQGVDLTGQYRCIQLCALGFAGQPAYVTQNGWNMYLVDEAGQPSRAWIDWIGHIWAENWNQGAIYSPDGLAIQFENGTVWQRDLGPVPLPVPPPVIWK